ncbi:response regulator transcription factor [Mangrovicoccus sp. HB161399]|uniref:response regulator n=1 Tax=Mangrovicoccus sp. HB161399 TaxID=2720392 RepID=UPI00155393A3|nr:response regulator transcription factor [Mangrovicoccus sp. HB161399]
MRVLLVEDSARLSELIVAGLSAAGFAADPAATLAAAEAAAEAVPYDLILLDLGLPDGDGAAFMRRLRRGGCLTPVLMVTARSGLDDKVRGLDAGADDYLVKPFELRELLARCRAVLRRPAACLGPVLSFGDIELDCAARRVAVAGQPVHLPPRETDLLELLLRRGGQVVGKPAIEQALYALASEVTPNALEAVVSRLRRHLAQAGSAAGLHTVRGIGYMLAAAERP